MPLFWRGQRSARLPRRVGGVPREQLSRPVDRTHLGGFLSGVFTGSFDEFPVNEYRADTDQRDEVGCVHGTPPVCADSMSLNAIARPAPGSRGPW